MAEKKSSKDETAQETALVKPDETMPDFLRDLSGPMRGMEELKAEDLKLPRLAIAQKMSKQIDEAEEVYIKGLKEGMFFNTLSQTIFGPGPLVVVPLFMRKHRIKFLSEGGIDCQSQNAETGGHYSPDSCAKCPFSSFGEGGNPPECDLIYDYPVVVTQNLSPGEYAGVGEGDMAVFSLKSTGISVAKEWNVKINMRKRDPFAGKYRLTTVRQKNAKGAFFNARVENFGWVTDPKEFERYEQLYNDLHGVKYQTDYTAEGDPDKVQADVVSEY